MIMSTETFSFASAPNTAATAPGRSSGTAMSCTFMASFLSYAEAPATVTASETLLSGHEGARIFVERRTHVDRNIVLHPNLHRTDLENLRTEGRKLEHFFETDSVDLLGRRADVRVGRVDPVDIGIDLANVRTDRVAGDSGDAGRVRPAAAEGGDVALRIDALKARNHRDLAGAHGFENLPALDRENPCLR